MERGSSSSNLVDFDTLFGHRNDVEGYASNLERFDERLGRRADGVAGVGSVDHHRRSRQRSDDAEHRSFARARPDSSHRLACPCRRRSRDAEHLCRPRPDPCRQLRRRALSPAAPASWRRSLSSIREALEQRERETLAPQAAKSAESRGRLTSEPEDDVRPAFQHDRDRIIHSKAFRRLKHKTQVFFAPEGDHYRTRLTHTLEVSQIARTIAKVLRLHEELTESIALGHDLGHTPFGHAGERVLDSLVPGRVSALRAEPAHRGRARKRRARTEPHVGGSRWNRPALQGQGGVARSASTRPNARRRWKGRSCVWPISSPTSTTTSTMPCGRA